MTLTKQQDALATKLRDAGVPGVFAVLVASRYDGMMNEPFPYPKNAVLNSFWWDEQPEGTVYWYCLYEAWLVEFDHMASTGVRYDD